MAKDEGALALRIEAVLFAAGKPLGVKELTDALGFDDHRAVQSAVRELARLYQQRRSAIEMRRVGDRYALQLREEFVPTAHSVTPVDMPGRTLRALTLIAYHQPIRQSVLVRMFGDAAYDEVPRLQSMGLIHAEPTGSTLELSTTRRFAEYFGIASTRPEEIRAFLEQKLGVAPSPPSAPPTEASASTPERGDEAASLPIEAASAAPPVDRRPDDALE